MIEILAVAFAAGPHGRHGGARAALTALVAGGWRPPGGRLRLVEAPLSWWRAPDLVLHACGGADGVVILADAPTGDVSSAHRFARNSADPRLNDSLGYHWPGAQLAPGEREEFGLALSGRGTARAMELAGLTVADTADCEDFIANRCAFEIARRAGAPPVGLIALPRPLELDRTAGARFNRAQLIEGAKAALGFAAAACDLALAHRDASSA